MSQSAALHAMLERVSSTRRGEGQLYPVDPSVPDDLRLAFNVPTLAQAMRRLERRNAGFDDLSGPLREV